MFKRIMQKLMPLCLAAAISLVAAIPAVAIQEKEGRITLSNLAEGDTATVYKIIDVNYDYDSDEPVSPEFVWVNGAVSDYVSKSFPAYIGTDNSVTDTYAALDSAEDKMKFNTGLAQAVLLAADITPAAKESVSAGEETLEIDGLDMGSYLVMINGSNRIYQPIVVNIVPEYIEDKWTISNGTLGGEEIAAKYSTPSLILETVSGGKTGAIGDIVDFKITFDVPQLSMGVSDHTVWVSDAAEKGFAVQSETFSVKGITAAGGEEALTENTDYVVNPDPVLPGTEGSSFVISFNNYESMSDYARIVITYSAEITANAADTISGAAGIKNTAKLHYYTNGNPVSPIEDSVTLYTYGIKVTKTGDNLEALSGAEFRIYLDEGNGVQANNLVSFMSTGQGIYRPVTIADNSWEVATATDLKTDSSGILRIDGLNTGKYLIVESKAPDGYIKLSQPVELEIKDAAGDIDGTAPNGRPEDGEGADFENGYVPVTIQNSRGMTLPVTGGMGTLVFAAAGVILLGGGITVFVVLVRHMRRREGRR